MKIELKSFARDLVLYIKDKVYEGAAQTERDREYARKLDLGELKQRLSQWLPPDLVDQIGVGSGNKAIEQKLLDVYKAQDYNSKIFALIEDLWALDELRTKSKPIQQELHEALLMGKEILQGTKRNCDILASDIRQAITRIPSWNDSLVVIEPRGDYEPLFFSESGLRPAHTFKVTVGKGDAGFTVFGTDEGKIETIDDVLEGGDEDFFHNSGEQADYFNLIKELRKPGSSSRGRVLTLYTARPVRDRHQFEHARHLPLNLFLTNDYDRAYGLAGDLGSSGRRDVWQVRINSVYLVETMSAGHLKDYQLVGSKPVPVEDMLLLHSGDSERRVAARWLQKA